jgi:tripartite-type tricarboxylate transporter receptor subunit TctC
MARGLTRLACAVVLLACACSALAQDWPAKPMRWIVGLPAGSAADVLARIVAAQVALRLKQPVLVENRPGASENIGMEHVARAAPDGYTFLVAATALVTNPHLFKLGYDPMKDLVPVAQWATAYFVLLARPSLPAATVHELLVLAKTKPGAVSCAYSSGAAEILCAWLKARSAADLTLVPYKGSLQSLNDVAGERADLVFSPAQFALAPARANRVRVLATTAARRGLAPFADAPTMTDSLPDFELVTWLGLMAPAGTPAGIIASLDHEIGEVLRDDEVRRKLGQGSLEVTHRSPEAFGEVIRRDYLKFERIIRETGIKAE